jgi:hypothetical protein
MKKVSEVVRLRLSKDVLNDVRKLREKDFRSLQNEIEYLIVLGIKSLSQK